MYRWDEYNRDDEMKFFEHGPRSGQGRLCPIDDLPLYSTQSDDLNRQTIPVE